MSVGTLACRAMHPSPVDVHAECRVRVAVVCTQAITGQPFANPPDQVAPTLDSFCCAHTDCDGSSAVRAWLTQPQLVFAVNHASSCMQGLPLWGYIAIAAGVLALVCSVIGVYCCKRRQSKGKASPKGPRTSGKRVAVTSTCSPAVLRAWRVE